MLWFLAGMGVLVLVLAPLRRAFFGNGAWRFTVPLVVSLGIGFVLGSLLIRFGLPPYVMLLGPAAAVLVVAPALREWLGENLGPRDGRGGGGRGNGT